MVDLDGISSRVVALPAESGDLRDLAAGADGQIYYIRRPTARRQAVAPAVRPQEPRGGNARRGDRRLSDLGRPQEDPLCLRRRLRNGVPSGPPTLGIVDAGKFNKGDGALPLGSDLGAGRAPRRMGADPPRSLADQPRLLLRDQHARRRLERRLAEIRRAPSPPGHPRRPEPRDADDAQRAVGRPQLPGRRRAAV